MEECAKEANRYECHFYCHADKSDCLGNDPLNSRHFLSVTSQSPSLLPGLSVTPQDVRSGMQIRPRIDLGRVDSVVRTGATNSRVLVAKQRLVASGVAVLLSVFCNTNSKGSLQGNACILSVVLKEMKALLVTFVFPKIHSFCYTLAVIFWAENLVSAK